MQIPLNSHDWCSSQSGSTPLTVWVALAVIALCRFLGDEPATAGDPQMPFGVEAMPTPVMITSPLESNDAIAAAEMEYRAARNQMNAAKLALDDAYKKPKSKRSILNNLETRLKKRYDAAQARVTNAEMMLRVARSNAAQAQRAVTERSAEQRDNEILAGKIAAAKIDDYFHRLWARSQVSPRARIDDATFLRRASLDLIGTIPRPEDLAEFLADTNPDKRAQWVDRLLTNPLHADYWGLRVRSWMLDVAPVVGQGSNTITLFEYLRESIALDVPYHTLVSELLTAEGHNVQDGAVSFPVLWDAKPAELAAATSSLFLGINIQCAQCHDDMFEGWTQEDFWGMAAFFTGLESKYDKNASAYPKRITTAMHNTHLIGGRDAIPGEPGEPRLVFTGKEMPAIIPDRTGKSTGQRMVPKPLQAERIFDIPSGQRRKTLVDWMTHPKNPFFDRAIVHRVWTHFFGRGFVPAPDGFQPSVEVEHAPLLEALGSDFRGNDRRLRHLMRAIVCSETYQLAIEASAAPAQDYSRGWLRPLDGDQWVNSLLRASRFEDHVAATNTNVGWDLRWFRHEVDKPTGPVTESLRELNSHWIRRALHEGQVVKQILEKSQDERLDLAFRMVLSRPPRPDEIELFKPLIETDDAYAGIEDALLVLLGSTEFVTR